MIVEGGVVVADHTWKQERQDVLRFCPSYFTSSSDEKQPKKLILEAFRIPSSAMPQTTSSNTKFVEPIEHVPVTIVGTKESNERPKSNRRGEMEYQGPIGSFGRRENRGCPSDVGWRWDVNSEQAIRREDGSLPFSIAGKSHYLNRLEAYNALCKKSHVYLSSATHLAGASSVYVEKRSLPDFQLMWKVLLDFDRQLTLQSDALRLTSIEETKSGLHLTILNEDGWTEMSVSAPFVSSDFK